MGSGPFATVGLVLFVISIATVILSENVFLIVASIIILVLYLPFGYLAFGKKTRTKIVLPRIVPKFLSSRSRNGSDLDKIAQSTEDKLYELSSVFPFDLFPNKVIIGQKQIILIYKQFFFASQVYNFLIQDILAPVVSSSVFFATLRIELGPGGFKQNPPSIRYLKKNEALKARRIIMGLIICNKEKIDLSGLSPSEIAEKTEEIGKFKSE